MSSSSAEHHFTFNASSPAAIGHEDQAAKYMTRPEAMKYTRTSRVEIERATDRGELPYYPRNQRGDKGFYRADLDAWIESRRIQKAKSARAKQLVHEVITQGIEQRRQHLQRQKTAGIPLSGNRRKPDDGGAS